MLLSETVSKWFIILCTILAVSAGLHADTKPPVCTDLFVSKEAGGDHDYRSFRLPTAVVTDKGSVLVFVEARPGGSDLAHQDIVMRRSADGGRSWEPMRIVAEHGDHHVMTGAAVQDRETGRIFLHYRYDPAKLGMSALKAGKLETGSEGKWVDRQFVIHSDDDGLSWSEPRDSTAAVKPPRAERGGASPSCGIQLRRGPHKGRLVIPYHWQWNWAQHGSDDGTTEMRGCAIYSDDHGKTWQRGKLTPKPDAMLTGVAEPQMVELTDGRILMNGRNQSLRDKRNVIWRGKGRRLISTSEDGGETWSLLEAHPTLPGYKQQAAMARYTDPLDGYKSRLLHASMHDHSRVYLSYDEGKTWPVYRELPESSIKECCLVTLPDMSIGLVCLTPDRKIMTFRRFTLEWLTEGRDTLDRDNPTE